MRYELVTAALHVLHALFDKREYAQYITYSSLEPTLSDLLTRFTDQRLKREVAGKELVNKINSALVRLLDHSDRENVMVCLLGFVNRSDGPQGTTTGMYGWKFHEYALRCLLKIIKTIKDIEFSNLSNVLEEADRFMRAHSHEEYAPHVAQPQQNPYAVVRTCVQELAKYHPVDCEEFATHRAADSSIVSVIQVSIRQFANAVGSPPVSPDKGSAAAAGRPKSAPSSAHKGSTAAMTVVAQVQVDGGLDPDGEDYMVRTDKLIARIQSRDPTVVLVAAQKLGELPAEAAAYVAANLETLSVDLQPIVRRAMGQTAIAVAVASHSFPSKRALIQQELTEVRPSEVRDRAAMVELVSATAGRTQQLSKGVRELQQVMVANNFEVSVPSALGWSDGKENSAIAPSSSIDAYASRGMTSPPRKPATVPLSTVRASPAKLLVSREVEPALSTAAATAPMSAPMSRLQMLKTRYASSRAQA